MYDQSARYYDDMVLSIKDCAAKMERRDPVIAQPLQSGGTPEKTIHFVEQHELALFEIDEMLAGFDSAGLAAMLDPQGITRRGLYIATKSKENLYE
jgi:hypothetical protein